MCRKVCDKENPMPINATGKWQHPDAEYIGSDDGGISNGGSYDTYKCPNCGKVFHIKIAD